MNNGQTRLPNGPVRDLPPKSPGNRRHMSTASTKIKRGEVKIYFESVDIRVVNRIQNSQH